MSNFSFVRTLTVVAFFVKAISAAIRELSPRVRHTNSWSLASKRWNASSVLKNPEAGSRMPRQDFLARYGKTHDRVQRHGKKVDLVKPWGGASTAPTTITTKETPMSNSVTKYNGYYSKAVDIHAKSYDPAVHAPMSYEKLGAGRHVFTGKVHDILPNAKMALIAAPAGGKGKDAFASTLTKAQEQWAIAAASKTKVGATFAPADWTPAPVVTAPATLAVAPTRSYIAHKVVRFAPATLAVAGTIATAAAVAADIQHIIKAHKAERRAINRTRFTLEAVIAMITATRKGAASKAGGVGFTAYANVATLAAVADAVIAIATTVGTTSTRVSKARKSMTPNQMIARTKRVKRQRRNGARRVTRLTTEQRRDKRVALAARLEAKAHRRAEAKLIAARVRDERVAFYAVKTRAAMCADLRARNNAIWMANGTEAPVPRATKEAWRKARRQAEEALPLAIQNRRRAAEGREIIGGRGNALARNVRQQQPRTAPIRETVEEALCRQAEARGRAVMAEILNGSESEPVVVPEEFMKLAAAKTAKVEEKLPVAKHMEASLKRSRVRKPETKQGQSTEISTSKDTAVKTTAAPTKEKKASVDTEGKKQATKTNRFDLVAEIWKPLEDKACLGPDELAAALVEFYEAYVEKTESTAKQSTVEGYLTEVYAQGNFDAGKLLSQEVIAGVLSCKEQGQTFTETCSALGLTTFVVKLAWQQTKPNKEKAMPKANPNKGQMEVTVNGPLTFTQDLKELECIHAFTLSHEGVEAPKGNDPTVVVLNRFGEDKCNANAHFGLSPEDEAMTEKFENYFYAANNEKVNVPVSYPLGFDYKEETKSGWNGSPVGVIPSRIHAEVGFIKKTSRVFRDAAFTNIDNIIFNKDVGHHVIFESLVEGKHDILDKKEGRREVGDLAARVRGLIREAAFTGSERAVNLIAKQGMTMVVHNALDKLTDTHVGITTPDGEMLDQHYLLVVARISKIDAQLRKANDITQGQYRMYASHFDVYFVPAAAAPSLFDLERKAKNNNFFSFIEQAEEDNFVSRRNRYSKTAKKLGRTPVVADAAKSVKKTPPATEPAKEDNVEKPTETTSRRRRRERVAADKQVADVLNKESCVSLVPEIRALYENMLNPSLGDRYDDIISPDEIIEVFSGMDKKSYMDAMHSMMPGVEEEDLETFLYGDGNGKGKKVTMAKSAVYAAAYYLYSHLSNNGEYACPLLDMPIADYDWQFSDVENLVYILQEVFQMARQKTRKTKRQKAYSMKEILRIEEVGNTKVLFIDNEAAFTFDEHGLVYDWRGRAFSPVLHIKATQKSKKAPIELDILLSSPIGEFIRMFWLIYMPIISSWSGSAGLYGNTFENLKSALQGCPDMFKMTTDRVIEQNGAAQHALEHTYAPLMHKAQSGLFKRSKTGILDWKYIADKPAKRLIEHYHPIIGDVEEEFMSMDVQQEKDIELSDVMEKAQHLAHAKYGIDFHYSKGQFVAGVIGHVNLKYVKQYAPTLFAKLEAELGCPIEAGQVIANTLKAQKGLKRVTLSLAQSTAVKDGAMSGWELYGQSNRAYGWLNHAGYAPTHVAAPGMSVFLGKQEDKPEANPIKRIQYQRVDFEMVDDSPLDFSHSTLQGMADVKWETSIGDDGWHYVVSDTPLNIKGGSNGVICGIHGGEPVFHQKLTEGTISTLRWRVATSMSNKSDVLLVEYQVDTAEFDMKSRQCNKNQYMTVQPRLLFNSLNPDLLDIEDQIRVVGLHLQDAMKMDTTYSWLFIVGCTVYHNGGSTHPAYLRMREMIIEINNAIVGHDNLVDGQPVLVIEPACVAAGMYKELQLLFEETFVRPQWLQWRKVGTMGRMLYDLYTPKVEAGKWHEVDKVQALLTMPELIHIEGDLVVYTMDEVVTNKTAILAFSMREGEVIEVAQRGMMFLSVPGFQLYNVELFESSTVKESVYESVQLLPFVKALGEDPKVLAEQHDMIHEGKESIYRAKALAAIQSGLDFSKGFTTIDIDIDEKGIYLVDTEESKEAIDTMVERLAAFGVDVDNINRYQPQLFKLFAHATKDIVFRFKADECATSMWLPALYAFTKLSSKSDETRDFVAMFFYDVLIPCVELRETGDSITLNQIVGVLDSLAGSRNTRKLLPGRVSVGAKRINLPNIPVGERWLLITNVTSSPYQTAIRAGIAVDKPEEVANGIYVEANRAPMPLGPTCRIRLVEEVWEKEGNDVVYRGQRLVPFANEVLPEHLQGYLEYELSPVQIGVDAMSVYFDRGDFDGDLETLTLIKNLGMSYVATYEQTMGVLGSALGMSMYDVACNQYAADHYGIKTYAKATQTLNNLTEAIIKDALKSSQDYVNYNIKAYEIQSTAVGVMYSVYMLGEIWISLTRNLAKAGLYNLIPENFAELLQYDNLQVLTPVLAEIYEIMLGGYSKGAEKLWDTFLKPLMRKQDFLVPDKSEYLRIEPQSEEQEGEPELLVAKHYRNVELTNDLLIALKAAAVEKDICLTTVVKGLFNKFYPYYRDLGLNRIEACEAILLTMEDLPEGDDAYEDAIERLENVVVAFQGERTTTQALEEVLVKMEANPNYVDQIEIILKAAYSYFYARKKPQFAEDPFTAVGMAVFEVGRGKFYCFKEVLNKAADDSHVVAYKTTRAFCEHLYFDCGDAGRQVLSQDLSLYAFDHMDSILNKEFDGRVLDDPENDEDNYWEESDINYFLNLLGEEPVAQTSLIHNVDVAADDKEEDAVDADVAADNGAEEADVATPEEKNADVAADEEEVIDEDGLFWQMEYLNSENLRDEMYAAAVDTFNKGEKSRFSAKKYSYTCAGDFYWIWKKGKGQYLTTQPDGSAIVEMPRIIKETAEKVVKELKAFDGEYEAQTCLINHYVGAQSLNTHVDKDEEVDAPIVSFSFGATGVFNIEEHSIEVGDGDLLVFYGPKRYAKHGYAGNNDGEGERYNVTVRMVKVHDEPEVEEEEEILDTPAEDYEVPPCDEEDLASAPLAKSLTNEDEEEDEESKEPTTPEEEIDMDYPNVVISGSRSIKEIPDEALDVNTIVINMLELQSVAADEKKAVTMKENDKIVTKTLEELLALQVNESTRNALAEALAKLTVGSVTTKSSNSFSDAAEEAIVPEKDNSYEAALVDDDAPELPPVDDEDEFELPLVDEDDLDVPLALNLAEQETKEKSSKVNTAPPAPKAVKSKDAEAKKLAASKELKTKRKQKRMNEVISLLPNRKNQTEQVFKDALKDLVDLQMLVPKAVFSGKNVMLTGVGGGGKTFTVDVVRKMYNLLKLPYVVVGSTGTSVMNVEGDGTINSIFNLSTGFEKSDRGFASTLDDFNQLTTRVVNSRFVTSAEVSKSKHPILVIVDEVSMVDNRLLHVIQDALEKKSVNVQWLLVGDPMQFVPCSGSMFFEKYKVQSKDRVTTKAGNSFVQRINAVTINLTENIRAGKDKEWVDTLNLMRMDLLSIRAEKDSNILWNRFKHSCANPIPEDAVHLFFNNAGVKACNRFNTAKMIAEGAEHKTYPASVIQSRYQGWHIKKKTDEGIETIFDPIEMEMTFCVDMPVMVRMNITSKTGELLAANGSRGFVTELGKDYINVRLSSNNKVVKIERTELHAPKDRHGIPLGSFLQIPAHPCFAMTMHKAQGLTLDCDTVIHAYYLEKGAVMPIPAKFANSLYVAFSRVTSADKVWIAPTCIYNKDKTHDQMWNLLTDSYHTHDKCRRWVEKIEFPAALAS